MPFPRTLRRAVLCAVTVVASAAVCAYAQESSSVRQMTLSVWAGAGPSVPTLSVSYRWLVFSAFHYSYPLNFLGPNEGIFDGHWEYLSELTAFTVEHHATAFAVGYTPIGFRYQMRTHEFFHPFVGGLAGMLYSTRRIPEGSSRFNFSPQAEAGLTVGHSLRHTVNFEVRYMHISNAGIYYPQPNPGINSVLILGGYTF